MVNIFPLSEKIIKSSIVTAIVIQVMDDQSTILVNVNPG